MLLPDVGWMRETPAYCSLLVDQEEMRVEVKTSWSKDEKTMSLPQVRTRREEKHFFMMS